MEKFLNKLLCIGIRDGQDEMEKRSIILSNLIAFILVSIEIILFISIRENHNISAAFEMLRAILVFTIPVVLNRYGYYSANRFYLCWVTPIYVVYSMLAPISHLATIPVTFYDGIRFYLLASGCLPYLLFGRNNPVMLILAILPSLTLIIFCDPILSLVGFDYQKIGIYDSGYHYTELRSIITYLMISGSCFGLKVLVENNDETNKQLLKALADKNVEIKKHADEALKKVNNELRDKLNEISEREFILKQSQRIANFGSWEYRVERSFTFWSQEMYNIFGLDKTVNPANIELDKILLEEDAGLFHNAIAHLLKTGDPSDLTVRTKTPVGYTKWLHILSFPLEENGDVTGVRGICHDVTYYKEAEDLLKEREFKYRNIFENAFTPICITDYNGSLIDANRSFLNLLKYNKEDLLVRNINQIIDPAQKEIASIKFDELKQGQHVFSSIKLVGKTGSKIDGEANIKNLGDNRIMFIIRDITEILKSQKTIAESEARFRAAFEYSAIGMAIISLEGDFVKVNKNLCDVLGYRDDALNKLRIFDITYAEDLPADHELLNEALSGQRRAYTLERRFIHKSKALIWVNTTVSLVLDATGAPNYFVIQVENINQRKKAELELYEAEAKFRILVEKSLVGTFIIKNNRFVYVNKAFCKIIGFSNDEVVNQISVDELIHPHDKPIVNENIDFILKGEKINIIDSFRLINKRGETIWVEAFGNKIPYKGDRAIIGSIIDITERKIHEKEQTLLASIVSTTNDAIISCSEVGNIKTWNPAAETIFGYRAVEAIGAPITKLLTSNRSDKARLLSIITDGKSVNQLEFQGLKKDKTTINISLTITAMFGQEGNYIGSSIVCRDETFRIQTERAIRESEARYRILVEKATDAVVVLDTKKRTFVNVSESAVTLFKYSKEELLKMGPEQISPEWQPDGNPSSQNVQKWVDMAEKKGKAVFTWTHCDSKGRNIPCEIRLVKLPSKNPVLIRASIVDISDRLAHEKELAKANKKIGELKLMALKSVMNPHFIFNVLNSIQYYITKNDRYNAINYLSTFSQLIRGVLNHSVSNKIKLSDELELLKNYIELEKIRFENKFEYKINVGPEIDINKIEIPSLLIQPYIENAILHGLYNKNSEGLLQVNIYKKGQGVLFEIEDNGIGRKASKRLQSTKIRQHKSMGIKLTEERLRLISENKNVSFNIQDLYDLEEPKGTRVTIGIGV